MNIVSSSETARKRNIRSPLAVIFCTLKIHKNQQKEMILCQKDYRDGALYIRVSTDKTGRAFLLMPRSVYSWTTQRKNKILVNPEHIFYGEWYFLAVRRKKRPGVPKK